MAMYLYTESDVRRFFESGDHHTEGDCAKYAPYILNSNSKRRRDSTNYSGRKKTSTPSSLSGDITNLSLLSDDSAQYKAPAVTKVHGVHTQVTLHDALKCNIISVHIHSL